eukprot:COSAG01_NODE_1964_length_8779_cov_447.550922_5_plen_72_part_00
MFVKLVNPMVFTCRLRSACACYLLPFPFGWLFAVVDFDFELGDYHCVVPYAVVPPYRLSPFCSTLRAIASH